MDNKTERKFLKSVCRKYGINPKKIIPPEVCGAGLQSAYSRGTNDFYRHKAEKTGPELVRELVQMAGAIREQIKDEEADPIKAILYTYLSALLVCEEAEDYVSLSEFIKVFMDTTLIKNGRQPITTPVDKSR